ncbi:MAG: electron transfer flavoprotein subunit beta/FixA family protein [bacterium]|nr:electron transfer flavoprotein subunit beta/FixA family protein [bacterium]MDI1337262.1 electron transfer flavoprotein subunit beta/FixA family protein [Lacunisphaera sp.]
MKILVPLKRVPDSDSRIRVRADGAGIETDGVKFSVNPFDSIALEEALRLREKSGAGEIVVVTIGGEECAEQLRTGLAMGADRAILVQSGASLDSLGIAKLLAAVYRKEQPTLVLMGKQAIDDDSSQAGQMLAGLLGVGQVTFVSKLELDAGRTTARCSRETDAGIEQVTVTLPAILTADLRLNEPRYVSLPGIMKAKKKPLETITPEALGVVAASRTRVLKLERPPGRKAGIRVKTVDELIAKLRDEAKVL